MIYVVVPWIPILYALYCIDVLWRDRRESPIGMDDDETGAKATADTFQLAWRVVMFILPTIAMVCYPYWRQFFPTVPGRSLAIISLSASLGFSAWSVFTKAKLLWQDYDLTRRFHQNAHSKRQDEMNRRAGQQ